MSLGKIVDILFDMFVTVVTKLEDDDRLSMKFSWPNKTINDML